MALSAKLRHLVCSIALFSASVRAAAPVASDANVTVLLFQTEATQHLQMRSTDASLQLCPTCAAQRGPLLMDLQKTGSVITDGLHRTLHTVQMDGDVAITTAAGHRAQVAGRWRIEVDKDRLRVRVQVTRERYVEAVLAAEAAPDEPTESLKALAVTVRSFAAATTSRHDGNALCDTTHCQALRFEAVPQSLRDAVWSTSGETLWWNQRQVPGYFAQHCGGYTEDAASAWGGPPQPWLTAHPDAWCTRIPSHWHASLSVSDVRNALASEGFPTQTRIEAIDVLSRDRSGRVQQVRVQTAGETRTLTAATLRFALNRNLGWNQLRSDRYQVQRIGDRFIFDGSGFGHGVGLCQAGATVMARAGKNYRDILHTYFAGAAVRVQSDDAGWQNISLNGLLLRTTRRDSTLQALASSAYADALSRWNAPVRIVSTITVFPSTESFRQATGQPGWNAAVTQGSRIATQPPDLLRQHGGAGAIFRHEFLHSFVESEAAPAAPLWLREGLVAVLNGEACSSRQPTSADTVEAALRASGSLHQSQQAHADACVLTRRFVAEHGMVAAHNMLRSR